MDNTPFGVEEPGVLHLFSSYVNEVFGFAFCANDWGVGGYPTSALNTQIEYQLLMHEVGHNYDGSHESLTICGSNEASVLDTSNYSIMHTSGFGGSKDMRFTDGSNNAAGRDNLDNVHDDWTNRGVTWV